MRRLVLFIPLSIFLGMSYFLFQGLYLDPRELPSALIDKPFPEFELTALEDGRTVTRKDILGEVSLVNVWATWCPSCRVEHPYLNKLGKKIPIFGINYKDEREPAKKWLERLHNPYRINIEDPEGRLGLDLGVYGAPETFVVDAKGVIRYKHVGVVDDKVWNETLKPIVESLR